MPKPTIPPVDTVRVGISDQGIVTGVVTENAGRRGSDTPMSVKYPKYYKAIPKGMDSLDIYAICKIFNINDPSGALHHAIKKLLLPGERTGGKSRLDDIKEARDTLSRYIELNK